MMIIILLLKISQGPSKQLLDVIAWRPFPGVSASIAAVACTDLLMKTCMMRSDEGAYYLRTYVRLFIGCLVGRYDLIY